MDMQTSFHQDDDKIIVANTQDVSAVLDSVATRADAGAVGSGDFKHAAQIPMVAIESYCNVKGITFEEWQRNPVHIKAMLNDPDLAAFRIWKGRV